MVNAYILALLTSFSKKQKKKQTKTIFMKGVKTRVGKPFYRLAPVSSD